MHCTDQRPQRREHKLPNYSGERRPTRQTSWSSVVA